MARDNPPQVVAPDDPTERKLSSPPPMRSPSLRGYEANGVTGPHESSPLLHHPPRLSNHPPSTCLENDGDDEWTMPNRSTLYMIWLTLVMGGLQIAWSVELAYISPYLLSLGLPKSTLSLIWVAGPVSGVIVQPLIGMISDRSKFKWGRRRIFIVISTIGVVAGFIGMGRTREIIRWWTGRRDWDSVRDAVIVLAIASLILLDLAINASKLTYVATDD
jgi:solute carrier family 45, member 1/2/4